MFTDMLKDRFRAGLRKFGVYSLIRRARGEYLEHLEHDTNEARFSHIYEKGLWTLGNKDTPLSGTGSTLHATADLRALLPELLKKLEVKVLLDLGCGDYSWMKHVYPCQRDLRSAASNRRCDDT
jgi:hypothetical protein